MKFLTKVYTDLKHKKTLKVEFGNAKQRLFSSMDLTDEEKKALHKVSLKIHNADTMYAGNALHYLLVGLSALSCICESLRSTGKKIDIGCILDFPCGYGRVLRFLRAMFPKAVITGAEIEKDALNFCERTFSAQSFFSKTNFSDLSLPEKYDLIWCGSLFTHINEQSSQELLKLFSSHLSDNGICVFTTNGERSIERLISKEVSYGLLSDAQGKVIRDFHSHGYGYSNYPNQSGYGISAMTYKHVIELASCIKGWDNILFSEHGWDNHQDVYAFQRKMPYQAVNSDGYKLPRSQHSTK